MTESELQVVRAAGFLAAAVAALVLQRLVPHGGLRGSWRVNGALWVVDALVVGLVCGACACAAARSAERAGIGLLHLGAVDGVAAVLVTVLALDLTSYWWHRANHRVPLLWRFHQVHHSDRTFTVSTGLRFHPGELLLSLPVRLAAVVLVGAPVRAVLIFEIAFTIANLVEHGDIRLGRRFERTLGWLLVTPALHRRHHTATAPARDTNFGTIFAIWDRSFRSFAPNDSLTRVVTGLPGLGDVSLTRALLLPFGR
ncbi:MAG TPA: sterol desaturase family protein [Candidatus Binatia bacterium]|nr:sterol desaturase family protein [Candidatus Binatia bacterium]